MKKIIGILCLVILTVAFFRVRSVSANDPNPPDCTNLYEFWSDVTIPDGTVFEYGDTFTKTWRLRNVGTCVWQEDYMLVGSGWNSRSGELIVGPYCPQANGEVGTVLGNVVYQNQFIDISIEIAIGTTRNIKTEYKCYYRLYNPHSTYSNGYSEPIFERLRLDGWNVSGYRHNSDYLALLHYNEDFWVEYSIISDEPEVNEGLNCRFE